MRKLRTFLAGLLLLPLLTLNAHAFTATDLPGLAAPQQSSGWCWVYYMGRWWQVPC